MNENTLVVHYAYSVRVAVGRYAKVVVVFNHIVRQRAESLFVRRGKATAEEGIVPLVNNVHVAAHCKKYRSYARLAYAVHGVENNP